MSEAIEAIWRYEKNGDWPTTYDIAAWVYHVKPDKDGDIWISDAQHVAIKRALGGLQRAGRIIGFRTQRARVPFGQPGSDGRTELCHHWMTEQQAAKWVAEERQIAKRAAHPEYFTARADHIEQKMRAIGMKPSK